MFCGTTQIDALLKKSCPLINRTIIRSAVITGASPVDCYLRKKRDFSCFSPFSLSVALISPFIFAVTAALSPSAAR